MSELPINDVSKDWPDGWVRVFPRRTKATPRDTTAYVGDPPFKSWHSIERAYISCVFTWDKPECERLAEAWGRHCEVVLGGPAYDDVGDVFVPGRFIRRGYVATSRGCIRSCPYCYVPKREGALRLLPITDGHDVIDNNLLATPQEHQDAVLRMLAQQKEQPRFSGGLDARLLTDWFVQRLSGIGLDCAWFAYDRANDKDPLCEAFGKMRTAGFTRHHLACYVLVGLRDDTQEMALKRLQWVKDQGATPTAMYYRGDDSPSEIPFHWQKLVRDWMRPSIIFRKRTVKERDNGQMAMFGAK